MKLISIPLASLGLTTGALAQSTAIVPAEQAKPVPVIPAPVMGPLADFNAVGDLSGNALIGATVRNEAKDVVGKVEDVYLSQNGAIKSVVLSIGGFLGIGSRYILMAWDDLKLQRDNESLVLTTNATKESLKAMPEFKFQRRPVRN